MVRASHVLGSHGPVRTPAASATRASSRRGAGVKASPSDRARPPTPRRRPPPPGRSPRRTRPAPARHAASRARGGARSVRSGRGGRGATARRRRRAASRARRRPGARPDRAGPCRRSSATAPESRPSVMRAAGWGSAKPPPIGASDTPCFDREPLPRASGGRAASRPGSALATRTKTPATSAAGTSRQMPPTRSRGPRRSVVARTDVSGARWPTCAASPRVAAHCTTWSRSNRSRPRSRVWGMPSSRTQPSTTFSGLRTTRRSGRGSGTRGTPPPGRDATSRDRARCPRGRAGPQGHRQPPAATSAASAATPESTYST